MINTATASQHSTGGGRATGKGAVDRGATKTDRPVRKVDARRFIERPKTVLIMAGGTGGHVYPGLAVAEVLHSRGYKIAWLGSKGGMEKELVANASEQMGFEISYNEIEISGVRGKGRLTLLKAPFRVKKAITQAKEVMVKIRPSIVIGMGGFASGPGGMAAKNLRIPLVIHEQNAAAGTTNKILRRFAAHTLVAFPESLKGGIFIGNPVRNDIENIESPEKRFASKGGPINVLVLGGSRGALAINEMIPAAFGKVNRALPFQIVHQTGQDKLECTQQQYEIAGVKANVVPYIERMAEALEWADFAICRAGALTVSELSAAGLGAVFIPFPHAIDDHQTKNAEFLQSCGAAIIKQQKELSPEILAVLLNELLAGRERLQTMAINARKNARPKAARKFADFCEELIHD